MQIAHLQHFFGVAPDFRKQSDERRAPTAGDVIVDGVDLRPFSR